MVISFADMLRMAERARERKIRRLMWAAIAAAPPETMAKIMADIKSRRTPKDRR